MDNPGGKRNFKKLLISCEKCNITDFHLSMSNCYTLLLEFIQWKFKKTDYIFSISRDYFY